MAEANVTATLTPARSLPPVITSGLLSSVDDIASRMARRLAEEIPVNTEFPRIPYLRSVVRACREGVHGLVRLLHDGRLSQPGELGSLGRAGVRQAELGVPLETLLSAYRLAARIVWEDVVAQATTGQELPPETVVAVSSQVLEYLDEISSAVGQAYLQTREQIVRQRDRQRDHVVQRLLAGDTSTELHRLAAQHNIHFQLPCHVLVCAVTPIADADRCLESVWKHAEVLLVSEAPDVWIALVNSSADVEMLWRTGSSALAAQYRGTDCPLVIGTAPIAFNRDEISLRVRQARRALSVGQRLHPERNIHHHDELGIFATLAENSEEAQAFVRAALGPLLKGNGRRNVDLLKTLAAMLHTRSVGEAAATLGLHRHTVVYRLQRLRDILSVDLDDPSERHRLWLAMQCQRVISLEEAYGPTSRSVL